MIWCYYDQNLCSSQTMLHFLWNYTLWVLHLACGHCTPLFFRQVCFCRFLKNIGLITNGVWFLDWCCTTTPARVLHHTSKIIPPILKKIFTKKHFMMFIIVVQYNDFLVASNINIMADQLENAAEQLENVSSISSHKEEPPLST